MDDPLVVSYIGVPYKPIMCVCEGLMYSKNLPIEKDVFSLKTFLFLLQLCNNPPQISLSFLLIYSKYLQKVSKNS